MRRILAGGGRVPRHCVLFSLIIAVAVILAASSFFGSGQAGAYHVETTSWTTITSFTTTSRTIETGIEIQTITIIGVVVVAALATVAALSRFLRKLSLTLPTKPASQLPGGSEGRFFHEGYSEDIPSPEEPYSGMSMDAIARREWTRMRMDPGLEPPESTIFVPGARSLRGAEGSAGGPEGVRSGVSGLRGAPRGEGAGRGREGGTPEGSSRMGGSEAEGPASSERGGEPVRSSWGNRGVVERSGGSGSGISGWSGAHGPAGAGGGSVSQGGSEVGGPNQEPSRPVSSPPEGGSEMKAPSSDASTPERSSQPFTPYQVAGPVVAGPSSDESTTESTPTTPAIEPPERTSDSVSETTPTEHGEGEQSPGEIPQSPPVLTTPSDQTDEKPHTVLTEDQIERIVDSGLEDNRSPEDIMKDLYRRDRTRGGSGDIGLKDPLVTVNTRNGPATARQSEANAYQDALKKLSELEKQDDEDFNKLPADANVRALFSTKEIRGGKIVRLPSHQISKARTQWSIEHGPAFGKLERRALGRNTTDETKEQDQGHIFSAGDRG